MSMKRCAACGEFFKSRPQTPDQRFCAKAECQRERRRLAKLILRHEGSDAATRLVRTWAGVEPGDRGARREGRSGAAERKRTGRRSQACASIPSGRYLLTPVTPTGAAGGASCLVEILVLSGSAGDGVSVLGTRETS